MWILRFKVFDEKNKINIILRKNKVKIYYYPINTYIKKNRYYFIAIGVIEADKKSKQGFFRDLRKLKGAKKDRRLELLEIEGDFFVEITSHTINREMKLFVAEAYNPALIHFEPVIWYRDGWEEWNAAAMDRKILEKLIGVWETKYKLKLLEFKQKKIKNFGFLTIIPELTDKQKKALKLAIEKGYYARPRKIDIQRLAKISKVAFSAFQVHLRKAENKIIPSLFERR